MSNASELMVPLKSRALGELAPDKKWRYNEGTDTLTWLDSGSPPSDSEINAKIAEIEASDSATDYFRKRSAAYPEIGDQLDNLYKDMLAGRLDHTGEWAKSIKAVKDAYPKS